MEQYQYFLGATPDINFSTNAIVGISNPVGSGVQIHVDVATICNLSKELCRIEICNAYHNLEGLEKAKNISMGNLSMDPQEVPKGEILYGKNIIMSKELSWQTRTLRDYETLKLDTSSVMTLAPGTCHYYIITALAGLKKPTISMTFNWWEEDV